MMASITSGLVIWVAVLLVGSSKASAVIQGIDCRAEGFFRNPNDCSRFYRCVPSYHGKFSVFHFSCASGTVFDEKFGVCNYEWNTNACGTDSVFGGSEPVHVVVSGPTGISSLPVIPRPRPPHQVLPPLIHPVSPAHPIHHPIAHPVQPIHPIGHHPHRPNHPINHPLTPVGVPLRPSQPEYPQPGGQHDSEHHDTHPEIVLHPFPGQGDGHHDHDQTQHHSEEHHFLFPMPGFAPHPLPGRPVVHPAGNHPLGLFPGSHPEHHQPGQIHPGGHPSTPFQPIGGFYPGNLPIDSHHELEEGSQSQGSQEHDQSPSTPDQSYPGQQEPVNPYPDQEADNSFPDQGSSNNYPGQQHPNNPYPGQQQPNDLYPGQLQPNDPHPGQQQPNYPYPGQQQPNPGQQEPNDSYPGQQQPNDPYPGQQQPNDPYPGQQQPNDPYPGQQQPNYPYPGQQQPNPGQQQPNDPYPGQQQPNNPYPGQQQPNYPYPGQQQPNAPYPGQQRPNYPYPGQQQPNPGQQQPNDPYPGQQQPNNPYPGQQTPTDPYPGNEQTNDTIPGEQPDNTYPGQPQPITPYPEQQPNYPYPGLEPISPYPEEEDVTEDGDASSATDETEQGSGGLPIGGGPGFEGYPDYQPTNPGQYPAQYPNGPDIILFPGQPLPEYEPEEYPDTDFIFGQPPAGYPKDPSPTIVEESPIVVPGGPEDIFPDTDYKPEIGYPGGAPDELEGLDPVDDLDDNFVINFPQPPFGDSDDDYDFPHVETDLLPEAGVDPDALTNNPFTTPGSSSVFVTPRPPVTETVPDNASSGLSEDYLSLPHSIFQCPTPGFFGARENCHEFYVCQEVLPGKLLADQVYRCPDRYLFDDLSQKCQREDKVSCNKFNLGYENASHKQSVLVVLEQYLGEFFGTPLKYEETRARFGISPTLL